MKNIILTAVLLTATLLLFDCGSSKKNVQREGDFLGARAHGFFMAGDIPRAIDVYKDSFVAARRADNGWWAARTLSNIGRAYFELGVLDSAVLYFAMAHEEFTMYASEHNAAQSAAWIALAFAQAGDNAQARQWLDKAIIVANSSSKNRKHFFELMRARVDFLLTSKIDNVEALNAAYKYFVKKDNYGAQITILALRADVEMSNGNCAAATRYLEDALVKIRTSQEQYRRSRILLNLAQINFCTGDDNRGKHFYNRALDTAPRGAQVPPLDEVSACGITCR